MNPTLYILMRTDLPSLNCGKACAQASHAANIFESVMLEEGLNVHTKALFKAWKGNLGFGTCIVLGCKLDELKSIVDVANKGTSISGMVLDPTYPFLVEKEVTDLLNDDVEVTETEVNDKVVCLREEFTCGFIFGHKEDIEGYVKGLKLHP